MGEDEGGGEVGEGGSGEGAGEMREVEGEERGAKEFKLIVLSWSSSCGVIGLVISMPRS